MITLDLTKTATLLEWEFYDFGKIRAKLLVHDSTTHEATLLIAKMLVRDLRAALDEGTGRALRLGRGLAVHTGW